jgi:hypothetical protein
MQMKTWKFISLILVIIATVNNSCSTVTLEKSTSAPSSSPSATIPPVTVTVTLAPTKTPVSQIDSSCWPIKPLQEGNNIKGSFVFIHYAPFVEGVGRKIDSFFAWDLSSFKSEELNLDIAAIEKSIGEHRLASTVVGSTSGDKSIMVTENDIIFISRKSAEFISLTKAESTDTNHLPSHLPAEGWFLINTFGDYKYGDSGIEDTYYILDSNTKEISKHKLFLPNFEKWNQWQGLGIYFSPNMKYVLYRSTHIIRDKIYGEDQFTLYDIENNKVVWVIPPKDSDLVLVGGDPHWIPNTNLLTAEFGDRNTDKSNYYLITINGKISPLNDLDRTPGKSIGAAQSGSTSDWSPNGRYLVSSFPPTHLWDSQAQTWYKPCLPSEDKSETGLIYQPIWSPDNSFFVAKLWFPFLPTPTPPGGRSGPNKMFVLDVVNKVIYEMPESIKPYYDMAESAIQEEFPTLYKNGSNAFLGWMNWEIP